mmetsp:Transcript_16539/g.18496  ORF Transcript_16539/g.18496 Transcript_16539/m.18496 type:complete len:375 (+) Transcript_16539:85-1209(+)
MNFNAGSTFQLQRRRRCGPKLIRMIQNTLIFYGTTVFFVNTTIEVIIEQSGPSVESPNLYATPDENKNPNRNGISMHHTVLSSRNSVVTPPKNKGHKMRDPSHLKETVVKRATKKVPPKLEDNLTETVNNICPLSRDSLDELRRDNDCICLELYERGNIAAVPIGMSFSLLKEFLKTRLRDENQNPFDIELAEVSDKEGKTYRFLFESRVWTGFILPYSKSLRDIFYKSTAAEAIRRHELEQLGNEKPELLLKVSFWIGDMLKFNNGDAEERLTSPSRYLDQGYSVYVNDSYFTLDEAKFLMTQSMPNGKSLQTFLGEKLNSTNEACTSHDIAPVLYKAFGFEKTFFKSNPFKRDYKKFASDWKKKKKATNRFY